MRAWPKRERSTFVTPSGLLLVLDIKRIFFIA